MWNNEFYDPEIVKCLVGLSKEGRPSHAKIKWADVC